MRCGEPPVYSISNGSHYCSIVGEDAGLTYHKAKRMYCKSLLLSLGDIRAVRVSSDDLIPAQDCSDKRQNERNGATF